MKAPLALVLALFLAGCATAPAPGGPSAPTSTADPSPSAQQTQEVPPTSPSASPPTPLDRIEGAVQLLLREKGRPA